VAQLTHLERDLVEAARSYDNLYHGDTGAAWAWKQEQSVLDEILPRYFSGRRPARYLDFACGTGRIASFLESRVEESVGVDVSPAMLAVAREKLSRTELVCADITRDDALPGPFDLITAFRFALNRDPLVRERAFAALAARLGPGGILIFNVHGNSRSLGYFSYLRARYRQRRDVQVLSQREVERLLKSAGLEIYERRGFGLLLPRLSRLLGHRVSSRVEATVFRWPLLQACCTNLLFICGLADAPSKIF
jgi:SAM-dependent methyltransferase